MKTYYVCSVCIISVSFYEVLHMRSKLNLTFSIILNEKHLENAHVVGEHFKTKTPFSNVSGLMAQDILNTFLVPKLSIIHNNTLKSQSAVVLSHQNPPIYLFRTILTVFTFKRCLICAYFSPDSDETTGESNIMDTSAESNGLKLKRLNDGFIF